MLELELIPTDILRKELSKREEIQRKKEYDDSEKHRIKEMKQLRTLLKEKGFNKRIIICGESDAYNIQYDVGWFNNTESRFGKREIPIRIVRTTDTLDKIAKDLIDDNNRYCRKNHTLVLYGIFSKQDYFNEYNMRYIKYRYFKNDRIKHNFIKG